jgi:outer membrane immunogenic protein
MFSGADMKKIAIGIATFTALIGASVVASAQSTESQSTGDILRRLQVLEARNAALAKENAALRERIKMSEENAKLRDRVSELKDSNQTTAAQQNSTTSVPALRRNDPKIALYDKASSAMVVKEPPPAPVPVYNWTGWYVGGNVGASFGNAKTDVAVAPVTVEVMPHQSFTSPTGFAGSNTEYPSGFMGGGQVGYNWQLSPIWVVGLEADFQGTLEKDSNTLATGNFSGETCCNFVVPVTGTVVTDYTTKIDWFGTVRGRIGYVWGNGAVLSYVTGGLAYGKVDLEGTNTVSGTTAIVVIPFSVAQAIGHSQVNTGWTVGYGTEGKLLIPGWTWKVEGLYMDLGTLDTTSVIPGVNAFPAVTGGQTTTHTHFTDGILRAGLNYQFH